MSRPGDHRFGVFRHTDHMQRVARDTAVASTLGVQSEPPADMRALQQVLDVAVSNALIQFAAMIQMEINRIDLREEQQLNLLRLQPSSPIGTHT